MLAMVMVAAADGQAPVPAEGEGNQEEEPSPKAISVEELANGSAGSAAYYQQELGLFGIDSGSVGVSGSLEYSYPLGQVSLSYSSETGRWRLPSSSSITRSSRWGVPHFDDSDVFVLDGMELIYSEGMNPRIYHTRRESYLRIEYNSPGTAASYWKITRKDGTVLHYGSTNDSRIEAVNRSNAHPRAWVLASERDAGEFSRISYGYLEDVNCGQYYLAKIVWGKSEAETFGHEAAIIYYEEDPNSRFSYREGSRVVTNRRMRTVLWKIGCDSRGEGGNPLRATEVKWIQGRYSSGSQVAAITEYGSDVVLDSAGRVIGGSSRMPTSFSYTEWLPDAFNETATWQIEGQESGGCLRQFNADNHLTANYIDITGDGLPDRVVQFDTSTETLFVHRNLQSQFETGSAWHAPGSHIRTKSGKDDVSDYVDMNGDGLPDRVMQNNSDFMGVTLNNGGGFEPVTDRWGSVGNFLRVYSRGNLTHDLMDFNGDGLPDRVWQTNNTLHVRLNTGRSFETTVHHYSNIAGSALCEAKNGQTIRDYIDMNGDGLPDRVQQNGSSLLEIYLNNGNGFERAAIIWNSSGSYLRQTSGYCTTHDYLDYDGDGLPDRMWQTSTTLNVRLNTGTGFSSATLSLGSKGIQLREAFNGKVLSDYLDLNGDGLLDRILQNNSTLVSIDLNQQKAGERLLTEIRNSQGGTISFEYEAPSRSDSNAGYKSKRWLVSSETRLDGHGYAETTKYSYFNGFYDSALREDRGYGLVRSDHSGERLVDTYYGQDELRGGLVEKVIIRDSKQNIFEYTYNI